MNKFYNVLFISLTFLTAVNTGFAQIFRNASDSAGVVFTHEFDDLLDSVPFAGGAAWGDINNNSRSDLFLLQTDGNMQAALFKNLGDATFGDSTNEAFPDSIPTGRGTSCAFTDYDNDGFLDLFIGYSGRNALYRNTQIGTFSDVTETVFNVTAMDSGRTMTIAWGDYDKDGYVDLFYANHATEGDPLIDTYRGAYLFHNDSGVTFTDVSSLLGSERDTYGTAAVFTDYDNDGDVDIFLATDCSFGTDNGLSEDQADNKLWRNDGSDGVGGWIFTEVADDIMPDICAAAKGVAIGDYNKDGFMDLYLTNSSAAVLLENNAGASFSDVAATAGVEFTTTTDLDGNNSISTISWGAEFFDYDNDGDEDLYVVAGDRDGTAAMANRLFANNGSGVFMDEFAAGDSTFDDGRGRMVAVCDYDKDGYMDMYVVNLDQTGVLLRNLQRDQGVGNRWLRVRLNGTVSNEYGIGARITAIDAGSGKQVREIRSGSGFGIGREIAAYFGFGGLSGGDVDSLIIEWPSGVVQTLTDEQVDRRIVVVEPDTAAQPPGAVGDLTATNSGTAIALEWGAVDNAESYNVYRGTEAYFDTSGNFLATVTDTTYDDVDDDGSNNVIGDPDNNYFYVVTTFGNGGQSDISNRVGEFDFDLNAGFNFITLPLLTDGLGDAQALGEDIDAQVGGDGAQAVYRMVGGSWELMAFKTGGIWILTVTDALVVGEAYLVDMNVAGTWSVAGGLEPDLSNSLDVGFNSIMLPFQKTSDESIADAEDLGTSIDNAGDGDSGNAIYRMVSGSWELMAFKTGGIWIVTVADAVIAGHGYLLKMDDSVTW